MDWKEFFKPTKTKIIIFILLIIPFLINYSLRIFCQTCLFDPGAAYCYNTCGKWAEMVSLPFSIIGVILYYPIFKLLNLIQITPIMLSIIFITIYCYVIACFLRKEVFYHINKFIIPTKPKIFVFLGITLVLLLLKFLLFKLRLIYECYGSTLAFHFLNCTNYPILKFLLYPLFISPYLIVNLFYWYILSCLIILVHNKFRKI